MQAASAFNALGLVVRTHGTRKPSDTSGFLINRHKCDMGVFVTNTMLNVQPEHVY